MRKYVTKKGQAGFTLIELMIVVAIVGILAVLAVYGVRKYITNAKTAEARNSLGQIGKDAVAAFEKESMSSQVIALGSTVGFSRGMCASGSAKIPAALTGVGGKKYQSVPSDWAQTATVGTSALPIGFNCMKFTMNDPQYFMYGYVSSGGAVPQVAALGNVGTTFTATAEGDLDGNGAGSIFTLRGLIQEQAGAGGARVLTAAPAIEESNPDD
jgi:type IV pilus assembly protein PilA